jgi:hypothetical protein
MMEVYLEKYSLIKSPKQGYDVSRLVASEKGWLEKDRSETVQRYRDWRHAVKNVGRIAMNEDLQSYIIRDRKHGIAKGLATIIFNQVVIHPDPAIGLIRGHNLDYWLNPAEGSDFHAIVAEELVYATGRPEFAPTDPYDGGYNDRQYDAVFTVVQKSETNPPIGLMGSETPVLANYTLSALGESGFLSVPEEWDDTYDVARSGQISQIYYRKRVVH